MTKRKPRPPPPPRPIGTVRTNWDFIWPGSRVDPVMMALLDNSPSVQKARRLKGEHVERAIAMLKEPMAQPKRNAPCSYGSKRRYRDCHGSLGSWNWPQREILG